MRVVIAVCLLQFASGFSIVSPPASAMRQRAAPPCMEVKSWYDEKQKAEKAATPPAESEEVKLSPVAMMRKQQAEAKAESNAYLDSRSDEMVKQQTIARGIFAVLVLILGYGASQAFSNIDSSAPAEKPQPMEMPFELPSLPINLPTPTFRTGYEGRTDIGTYRPLFPEGSFKN